MNSVHSRLFLVSVHLNHTIFFCQLGECWAGHSTQHNYARYGSAKKGCIQDDFQACQKNSRYCMGGRNRNMVYRIGKCHIKIVLNYQDQLILRTFVPLVTAHS